MIKTRKEVKDKDFYRLYKSTFVYKEKVYKDEKALQREKITQRASITDQLNLLRKVLVEVFKCLNLTNDDTVELIDIDEYIKCVLDGLHAEHEDDHSDEIDEEDEVIGFDEGKSESD